MRGGKGRPRDLCRQQPQHQTLASLRKHSWFKKRKRKKRTLHCNAASLSKRWVLSFFFSLRERQLTEDMDYWSDLPASVELQSISASRIGFGNATSNMSFWKKWTEKWNLSISILFEIIYRIFIFFLKRKNFLETNQPVYRVIVALMMFSVYSMRFITSYKIGKKYEYNESRLSPSLSVQSMLFF